MRCRRTILFEPLAVQTASVHDSRVSWFHPVCNPAFLLNTQFIYNTLIFRFIQTMMKFPAMTWLTVGFLLPHIALSNHSFHYNSLDDITSCVLMMLNVMMMQHQGQHHFFN